MLARLDLRGYTGDLEVALWRVGGEDDDRDERAVRAAVSEIIADVRERGDTALRALTKQFDGIDVSELRVHRDELRTALDGLEPDVAASLEFARDQIVSYHEAQRDVGATHERSGVHVHELVLAVDRAGLYVPGGRAAYPSTVLMTAVPAKVAGVRTVALCVPADRTTGRPPAATLAAAEIAGVDEVYCVGGAQAIAAMAYGTQSIEAVDVIVGPGNAYVAEAKRQVYGVVGIDGLAGPSEIVVIADSTVPARFVAADLLAQAEHGPGGAVTLITWEDETADEIISELVAMTAASPRVADATATFEGGGRCVLVDSPDRAMEVSNEIAPEHLELMCADASQLVPFVRHAGAVFVGQWAPAAIGDYVAGVNHVLPTGRSARFASALRVADFQKRTHVVMLDRAALDRVGPYAATLADAEGLAAHAQSVRMREASK